MAAICLISVTNNKEQYLWRRNMISKTELSDLQNL